MGMLVNMSVRPVQQGRSRPFTSHETIYLTPCSRVLPEKLTDPQVDKKLPAFYGTGRFITLFTSARHLSLS